MQVADVIATLPHHQLHAALRTIPLPAFEAAIRGHRAPKPISATAFDLGSFDEHIAVSLAVSDEHLAIADDLVRRQYEAKGYHYPAKSAQRYGARRRGLPILAWLDGQPVGTATLGIDSPAGLNVDDVNREHVDVSRAQGHPAGEVVKLAASEGHEPKRVLAALFGALHRMMVVHELVHVFIEVNPRHVSFYRRALCFAIAGPEKICPRVGAPSVLLRMCVSDLTEKIRNLQSALVRFPLN
jgi:hypothetical protein